MSSPPPPKATLHARHISTLPYENLSLRHAKEVDISLDVRRILGKFMANGRGGCCMEHSIFFNNVFRALGFQVHLTGARARQGDYKGWVHVANIVTLPDGTKWVSDTGFGGDGDGMRQPMPLVKHHITQNIGPQEIRFEHAGLVNATNTAPDEKRAWIYQYRSGADQPWNSFFCFTETEFLHQDHWTSKHADCFQTWTPMAVELLRREGADGVAEIYGKLMLANGDVKENLGGKTGLVRSCKSEAERLEALRDVFGMSFTEEQQAGITGRRSELLPNWRNDGAERGVVDVGESRRRFDPFFPVSYRSYLEFDDIDVGWTAVEKVQRYRTRQEERRPP